LYVIISGISSLCQHLNRQQLTPEDYRPARCPPCGMSGLHCHGSYTRKANRRSVELETDEPIIIPRFRCPHCCATCSSLPEAIPPRRHYLWCWQQLVLLQWLGGMSLNAIAKQFTPSRKTIKRWLDLLRARFALDTSALCNRFAELGRFDGFSEFWQTCLKQMSLASAMLHIHELGTSIP
jgi:transposase-like protein